MHDARVGSLMVRDPSGDVVDRAVDRHLVSHDVTPIRSTHFTGRRVFWSSRPMGTAVVTVFTLPPGRYEIVAWGEAQVIDDAMRAGTSVTTLASPLSIVVPPRGVAALGAIECTNARCKMDRSTEARHRLRTLLAWEMLQPHAEADLAIWRAWLPAIDDDFARPEPGAVP
jgi:hypothetical protein